MGDFIGKIIGVILAFMLLVVGPMVVSGAKEDLERDRSVLNEMTNFLDKVSDNGRITNLDKSNLYLAVNSYGASMDVTITRQMRVLNPDGAGGTYASYMVADDISTFNQGDIVVLTVKAVNYTGMQEIINRVMKQSKPKFDVTFSARVRN